MASSESMGEKIAKLPVWAQNEFARLTLRLAEAQAEVRHFKTNPVSRVYVREYGNSEGRGTLYLRNDDAVAFSFSDDPWDCVQVSLDKRDPRAVEIYVPNSDELVILPRSSNVFLARVQKKP